MLLEWQLLESEMFVQEMRVQVHLHEPFTSAGERDRSRD